MSGTADDAHMPAPGQPEPAADSAPSKRQRSRWRFVQRSIIVHYLMVKRRQRIGRTSTAALAIRQLNADVLLGKSRFSREQFDELRRTSPRFFEVLQLVVDDARAAGGGEAGPSSPDGAARSPAARSGAPSDASTPRRDAAGGGESQSPVESPAHGPENDLGASQASLGSSTADEPMDADGIGASGAAGESGVAEVSLEPNSRAPPRLFPRAGADTRDPDGIEDEDDAVSVSNEGVPRPLAAPRAPLHAMRKFCGTLLASTQLTVLQKDMDNGVVRDQ